jgi:penicillin V acylase-like amidase (Ntn superfamily)
MGGRASGVAREGEIADPREFLPGTTRAVDRFIRAGTYIDTSTW